ncbi:hypothetical protein HAX54_043927 [Datura stramonium]|uniref:Secreted protein n=1 Tax=Datura stramonium TaxID=4076 RepID=A0ABS8W5Y2_DATST|nr:hypothetical protein [Datura stramonium]
MAISASKILCLLRLLVVVSRGATMSQDQDSQPYEISIRPGFSTELRLIAEERCRAGGAGEPTGKVGRREELDELLVLAVAVGGGGSTKKHATTQSTGEPLPALRAGGYRQTQRLNQPDPPKLFPLNRMRLPLRDLLVIGPPLLARKKAGSGD